MRAGIALVFLALGIALTVWALRSVGQKNRISPQAEAPMRIIDAHAHWDSNSKEGAEVQPSPGMLAQYAENHIVGAVVHSSRSHKSPKVIDRKGPLKIALCAGLGPDSKVAEVSKGLTEGFYQCLKVYLGYVPVFAYDKFYKPYYRLAEKFGVPVVFHTGDTYDKMAKVKYADPLTIDEVAVEFPKVKFVIAHLGNPWFQSAAEVIYKNDNVYADLSALMLDDLSQSKPESVDELVVKPIRWVYLYVENPKKLMFGTDWPLVKLGPYVEAVKRAIPREAWEDVFYKNAVSVFKVFESTVTNAR